MSDSKSRLIIEGKFRPGRTGHKKGWYEATKPCRKLFFRSSWEEAVMKYLDVSPDVKSWDYECVRIPYMYDDHKRWYVPDFIVLFQDGRHEMWEVKPKEFLQTERVRNTCLAGEAYCREHGINSYRVITRDVLQALGII